MRSSVVRRSIAVTMLIGASLWSGAQGGATVVARQSSPPQLGVDTYFVYNCQSLTLIDKWATTQVADIKALGANAIGIGFPLYTSTLTSNQVFGKLQCNPSGNVSPYMTPPPDVLASVVQIAHQAGLQVLLRPLLDQENLYAQNPKWWRGLLRPTNPTLWIQNYLSTLRPYLLMSQQTHVEHFAIETELDSLTSQRFWPAAITLAKRIYGGDLVFNYNWEDSASRKVLKANTTPSLDTYPKTKAGPNATVRQLLAQWNLLLKTDPDYAVPHLSSYTIDEIGITAQWGAYLRPQSVLPIAQFPFNQWIQLKWFQAACTFAQRHKLQGIYYWGTWLTSNHGAVAIAPNEKNPSAIQPGGARAIKRCFTSTGW